MSGPAKHRRRAVDPYAYLKDVVTHLPQMTMQQVPKILPVVWGIVESLSQWGCRSSLSRTDESRQQPAQNRNLLMTHRLQDSPSRLFSDC
jgi:hypothetical protein